MSKLMLTASCDGYPFEKYRKVAYINSSGICNLDCDYCFTNSNKRPVSISNADMDFLFKSFGDNFLLCFSGQGDFFSGYKKSDRFLEHLLSRDVTIYLDCNGSMLQEFFEIPGRKLNKIATMDVSYHYETMKKKKMLDQWADNIAGISEAIDTERWFVKGVIAMQHLESLHEKIAYYANSVFPRTNKKLKLVLDDFDNRVHSAPVIKLINSIIQKYPEAIKETKFIARDEQSKTTCDQFVEPTTEQLFCPAGSLYFKIGIDGTVAPCNKLMNDNKIVLGNLKEKKLGFIPQLIPCSRLPGPGCLVNWDRAYPQFCDK